MNSVNVEKKGENFQRRFYRCATQRELTWTIERQAEIDTKQTHEKDVAAKRHAYSRRMRVVDCSPTENEIIEKSIDSPFKLTCTGPTHGEMSTRDGTKINAREREREKYVREMEELINIRTYLNA